MSEETTAPASTESSAPVVDSSTGESTGQTMTYGGGKYDSVSALENGYSELQKSYSQKLGGFSGSPEDGYVTAEGFTADEGLAAWGKENQLSQAGYDSYMEATTNAKNAASEAANAEQMKLLGENADYRLNNIRDYATANLGEGAIDTLDGMLTTAAHVEMFERMMQGQHSKATPAEVKSAAPNAEKVKQMRYAMDENSGQRRMSIDPKYAALVRSEEGKL